MQSSTLKECLRREGATLVGVGDVTEALTQEIIHLNRGVSLAVNKGLSRDSISHLRRLQKLTEGWLRGHGYRSLSIPPDSDRIKGKYISKLYHLISHKTAATCSGLGWIGKNGLIITREYGSKLSWATVLTDAPLPPNSPTVISQCGDCDLCVRHCPSGALCGNTWSREDPLRRIVNYDKCRSLKKGRVSFHEKPNCGLCVIICPHSRNGRPTQPLSESDGQETEAVPESDEAVVLI